MTEAEVLELFRTCSNHRRWGTDDQLGTLNYVTPSKRLKALAAVRDGVAISFGRDLAVRGSRQLPPSAVHVMTYAAHDPASAEDLLVLSPHGFEMTHLDAVGHSFFAGELYNGRRAADTAGKAGLVFGSIYAMREGIVTRGILLDVGAARGVDFLAAGEGIGVADLEAAERLAEVKVGRGDAIFVRSGHERRLTQPDQSDDEPREGVLAEVLPWLHRREIALYGSDCIERLPSGYARVPLPLHQIGLVAMGLAILDCPNLELLASACRQHRRHDFLLTAAPLRIPGGTGSPVNPIAIF